MADNIVITTAGAGGQIEVQQDDVTVVSAASIINIEGNAASVLDETGGKVTITVSAPTTTRNDLFRHNSSTTQSIPSTYTTLVFPTQVRQQSDYTYSSGTITFQRTGWYKITYDVGIDNDSSSNRTNAETAAFLNSVEIGGSKVWTYHRNSSNGEDTGSATFFLEVSTNDQLTIQSRHVNGSTLVTIADSCRINIERIA